MFRLTRRKVIGYRAKRPMNYLIFQPVHEELARDPRLAFLFWGKLHGRREARALYERAGAERVRVVPNFVGRYYPFDLYVSADFSIASPRAHKKVHMFHGVSFKNHAVSPHAREYDAVFVVGPYMERQFVRRGIFEEGDPRMRRVGMPKLDRLLGGTLDRARILEDLGCRADRPTVLYAPTWGDQSSLGIMGEDVLRNLCGRGLNLVVKLHDNSYDPRKNPVRWAERLAALAHADLAVGRTADVVPLLFAADVLISDASSVSNEFLLLDRPIIFLEFEGQLDAFRESADVETWGRKVGETVRNAADIGGAVDRALADPRALSEIRRQAARDIFYGPGGATARAVAEIYRLLELDPPSMR